MEEKTKPVRPFRARTLPLDGGFDVKVSGKDASEEDIYIEYASDRIVILTGDAAMQRRIQKLNASVYAEVPVVPPDPRDPRWDESTQDVPDRLPDFDLGGGWDGTGPEPKAHRAKRMRDPQADALKDVGASMDDYAEDLGLRAVEG